MTFDPHFRFYREDPQSRACARSLADCANELREEMASRRNLYPALVAKGRMTADVMARELRVMSAILWEHIFPIEARPPKQPYATWTEKVHALRREIGLRRTLYPRWILAGRIDPAIAETRLTILEELHELYWFGSQSDEAVAVRAETLARAQARSPTGPLQHAA